MTGAGIGTSEGPDAAYGASFGAGVRPSASTTFLTSYLGAPSSMPSVFGAAVYYFTGAGIGTSEGPDAAYGASFGAGVRPSLSAF